jgi:hypothetical protein
MKDEPGAIHWLDLEESKILKEELGDDRELPKYLLPERSIIEQEINNLREHYLVPADKESTLDELVFRYEGAVSAALAAIKRWEAQRGPRHYEVHALLQLELPEIIAVSETIMSLEQAADELRLFLVGLETKGRERLPDFMKEWVKMENQRRFDEEASAETQV